MNDSRSKFLVTAVTLLMVTLAAFGTVRLAAGQDSDSTTGSETEGSDKRADDLTPNADQHALVGGPVLRGEGEHREILVRGHVLDSSGAPTDEFELDAKLKKHRIGLDRLPVKVEGNEFEVWIPISTSLWIYVELTATANNRTSRVFYGIANRRLRQAAIEGVVLQLKPTNRSIQVRVADEGMPVADAQVSAQLSGNMLLHSTSDTTGLVTFRLGQGEALRQLTAWTDDFRIGGFSFSRKPRRDPRGTEFTIELDDCRDQTIRLLDTEGNSPIPNLLFEIVLGTGQPNYNFAAVPATFPHCRMTTDNDGNAIFRWFPDWETHGTYIEMVDPRWATAVENNQLSTADDGALVMTLKRRVARKPIVGTVKSGQFDVGGLLVEIKSFQGEQEGRSDHVYAFTDKAGQFRADCIPGATYSVCVNDGQLQSEMIDLIPYELDTGNSNVAELNVAQGNPIEIRVTSGPNHEPMRNQRVYVRQTHRYTRMEKGEERSGSGARDYPVFTDDKGVARARALAGSELRVSVNAGEWRSEDRKITVDEDGVTSIEFHREIDEERQVEGRLLAPPDVDVELSGAEIVFGSIDGHTDEREKTTADAAGQFAFKTKAIELGVFAYVADGKAAGVAKPNGLDGLIELQLKPTMDLHGQLLDENEEPIANHPVRVTPQVSGMRDFSKSFATSFRTKTFATKTDENGNYTLKNLPCEFDMTLISASIDDSKSDLYLDDFYLVAGQPRTRIISRLGDTGTPDHRTFSEKYDGQLRMAMLDNYHLLVLIYDSTSRDFVNTKLLRRQSIQDVQSYLNLRIDEGALTKDVDRQFAQSKSWPHPTKGKVFVAALDATGKELGRVELGRIESGNDNAAAATKAAEFIRQYAPPQADAKAKWDAAFAEAKRSGRHVWARIGQRYCGPCFRMSRWLDDNRNLIERDYVLVKIDNVRDFNGTEIANRIVSDRERYGVPFHGIFDAEQKLLIDSESPTGNIGHPSGFAGLQHVTKMLNETRHNLSKAQIQEIVATLAE